jgi:pimeloyl-ACP methyl ester carboxylesterase
MEAARLDEMRLSVMEERGAALLRCGDIETARAEMDRLVRERPLRERARMLLMRTLYAGGQQADALAQYRAYRSLVVDDLGLEPSLALRRLERAILRHDPALQTPALQTPTSQTSVADANNVRSESARSDLFADLLVRYATAHTGRRLAYVTFGTGPPLVVVPAWISSLEVIALGRDPRASLLERLSHSFSLTIYDRYGTGLSPGEVGDFSLDGSVSELTAIAQHIGGPVNVLAVSQAGPVGVTLAAIRPDLVSRLVLIGTFADAGITFQADLVNALLTLIRRRYGLAARIFAELYRPNSSDEYADYFSHVLNDSASAQVAADYLAATYEYDAGDRLSRIAAPALVIHYRDDQLVPFAGGQQLAAGLPNARLMPLDGCWHLPDVSDLGRVVSAIRNFVID